MSLVEKWVVTRVASLVDSKVERKECQMVEKSVVMMVVVKVDWLV
jgi:hypothetical protein